MLIYKIYKDGGVYWNKNDYLPKVFVNMRSSPIGTYHL